MTSERRVREETALLRALLGVEPDDDSGPVSAHDERILATIVAADRGGAATAPHGGRRALTLRRTTAAVAVAAAVVVAVVAWPSGQSPAAATPPMLRFSTASVADIIDGRTSPAAAALDDIADDAAKTTPVVGSGSQRVRSYAWYLNTTVDSAGHSTVELAPTFQTTTLAADGSFVNRESRAAALSVDGKVIDPGHFPVGGAESEDRLPAGTMDSNYAASLPRDPAALRQAFITHEGGDACLASDLAEATCLYGAIVDLYTHWVVPSDLSAAVWRTLAHSPAVVDLGTTVDRLGRTGHAVAVPPDVTGANQVVILVIDPETGQMLSWEQVSVAMPDAGIDGPVVSGFQAIAEATWVTP